MIRRTYTTVEELILVLGDGDGGFGDRCTALVVDLEQGLNIFWRLGRQLSQQCRQTHRVQNSLCGSVP